MVGRSSVVDGQSVIGAQRLSLCSLPTSEKHKSATPGVETFWCQRGGPSRFWRSRGRALSHGRPDLEKILRPSAAVRFWGGWSRFWSILAGIAPLLVGRRVRPPVRRPYVPFLADWLAGFLRDCCELVRLDWRMLAFFRDFRRLAEG